MQLTLLDLFRIGRNAVQLYPANPPNPCLQPQAFRVLQKGRGIEVGTPNWGAVPTDKDTPFFWSRKWHNSRYNPNGLEVVGPVVAMYEMAADTEQSPFAGNGFKRCYTVEVAVLDTYHEDCTGPDQIGCKARPVNQIYLDTGLILDNFLQYFGQMVGATTSADPVGKMYFLPWLQYQKAQGNISTFTVTYTMQNTLNGFNPKMQFSRVEMPTQKIFGTRTQFKFCTNNCPAIEYDTALEDFGVLAFEAGCKNC